MKTFGDLKPIALLVGYILKANPRLEIFVPWRHVWEERASRYILENGGQYRVKVRVPQKLLDWRVS